MAYAPTDLLDAIMQLVQGRGSLPVSFVPGNSPNIPSISNVVFYNTLTLRDAATATNGILAYVRGLDGAGSGFFVFDASDNDWVSLSSTAVVAELGVSFYNTINQRDSAVVENGSLGYVRGLDGLGYGLFIFDLSDNSWVSAYEGTVIELDQVTGLPQALEDTNTAIAELNLRVDNSSQAGYLGSADNPTIGSGVPLSNVPSTVPVGFRWTHLDWISQPLPDVVETLPATTPILSVTRIDSDSVSVSFPGVPGISRVEFYYGNDSHSVNELIGGASYDTTTPVTYGNLDLFDQGFRGYTLLANEGDDFYVRVRLFPARFGFPLCDELEVASAYSDEFHLALIAGAASVNVSGANTFSQGSGQTFNFVLSGAVTGSGANGAPVAADWGGGIYFNSPPSNYGATPYITPGGITMTIASDGRSGTFSGGTDSLVPGTYRVKAIFTDANDGPIEGDFDFTVTSASVSSGPVTILGDTYTDSENTSQVNGASTQLYIDASGRLRVWVVLDASTLTGHSLVTLTFYGAFANSTGFEARVAPGVDASTLNHANAPAVGALVGVADSAPNPGSVNLDGAMLRAAATNGAVSVVITLTSTAGIGEFVPLEGPVGQRPTAFGSGS